MAVFQIKGGKRLNGEIVPQGAKNEVLQILCAVLLTTEKVRIKNIPDIQDVNRLIDILGDLGVKIQKNGKGDYTFKASNIRMDYLHTKDFKKDAAALRGSIMLMGPLLAKYGKAYMPKPGGDKIGRRRLDTHLDRKSTRLNSSHVAISYAVFCLKKKKQTQRLLQ